MTHKVRLLDHQGYKIDIIEVETNTLANHAILAYDGKWFVFGGIAHGVTADFDFRQVNPPHCMKPDIDNPTLAAQDAAVQIGEEAFRAGFKAAAHFAEGNLAMDADAPLSPKAAEALERAWAAFEPSEATKGLIA